MSHPFGDLLSQYRAGKPGLSQARLAHLAGYDQERLPSTLILQVKCQKQVIGPGFQAV
jgi:hypothetical protein